LDASSGVTTRRGIEFHREFGNLYSEQTEKFFGIGCGAIGGNWRLRTQSGNRCAAATSYGTERLGKEKSRPEAVEYTELLGEEIASDQIRRLATVPLVGDEANLAIVAAKPQENLDKVLIVCGGAEIRDYYN